MKDHFQEFNNSIGLYRGLVMNLTASQDRLRKLRDTLTATKESITKRGGDLSISLNRSQQYKEMLKLLQIMFVSPECEVLTGRERLQSVPDKIENLITEKQFTSAVDILSEAIKILQQPEFKNVGALQDVSAYLKNQEAVFPPLICKLMHSYCMTCLLKSCTIISISNHHTV
jgi:exocyst complex component 4